MKKLLDQKKMEQEIAKINDEIKIAHKRSEVDEEAYKHCFGG